MEIRIFNTGTPEYDSMVDLRMRVLLEPIGVPRSYIDPLRESGDTLIGAFDGQKILGCCILSKIDEERLQLRQMAVESIAQGKGIGAAIVRFAENEARLRNYRFLVMHARDVVIDFYTKCGYYIAGGQFFEVGIPHHKMERVL
jgi:GNAT superfamily N-acetyltransferase